MFGIVLLLFSTASAEDFDGVSLYTSYFYDEYGSRIGLPVTGGFLETNCIIDNFDENAGRKPCDKDHKFELLDGTGTVIDSSVCERNGELNLPNSSFWESTPFHIPIVDAKLFTTFKCRYTGYPDLGKTLELKYRLCGDHEPECQQECGGDSKFCIVTGDKIQACADLTESMCSGDDTMRSDQSGCPSSNPTTKQSMCKAIATHGYTSFLYASEYKCAETPSNPTISIGKQNRKFLYRDLVLLNRTDKTIELVFEGNDHQDILEFGTTCQLLSKTSPVKLPAVQNQRKFQLTDDVFNAGSHIYRLDWRFWRNRDNSLGLRLTLAYYLIVIEGEVIVKMSTSSDGKSATLSCKIAPSPSENFTVSYAWKSDNGADLSQEVSSTITVTAPGKYTCEATPTYRTCRPYRTIKKTLFNDPAVDVQLSGGRWAIANVPLITLFAGVLISAVI